MPDDEKQLKLMAAKRLWVAANVELHQGRIAGYFNKAEELHQFMSTNKLEPQDLAPLLKRVNIVPQSFSRLQAIYEATSAYSRGAATEEESSIECSLVSAIGKVSAFFMDCKLKKNERATPDPNFQVSRREVTISIMGHIQDVVDPETVIGATNAAILMGRKIEAVHHLASDDKDALESIYAYKGKRLDLANPITGTTNIISPNTGEANLTADWSREVSQKRMLINGIPLHNFSQEYDGFKCSSSDLI